MSRSKSVSTLRHLAAALLSGLIGLTASVSAGAAETESSIARGGRLYDKYFKENNTSKPDADHPSYPHKGGKYGKDASWRCTRSAMAGTTRARMAPMPAAATPPASRASTRPPARTSPPSSPS